MKTVTRRKFVRTAIVGGAVAALGRIAVAADMYNVRDHGAIGDRKTLDTAGQPRHRYRYRSGWRDSGVSRR
jgi:hypothetical protein